MLRPVFRSRASRPRLAWAAIAAPAVVLGSIGACNQILGNESTDAITRDGGPDNETPDAPLVVPPRDAAGTEEAGPLVCGLDSKPCGGACVSRSLAELGCGATSCAPCDLPFANVVGCDPQGGCALGDCKPDHANCDGDPTNGCEVDLLSTSDCGECDIECGPGEVCANDGEGYVACDPGVCLSPQIKCNEFCTDPTDDTFNCGICGHECAEPQIAEAYALCSERRCSIECEETGKVFCGALCLDQDDLHCGPTCARCSEYANKANVVSATGACLDEGYCEVSCAAGFADANLLSDDGCEQSQ